MSSNPNTFFSNPSKKTTSYKVLFAYLIFSFLFYAYRYPLSYNDEGTSGTYSSTPFAFQVSKYFITILFTLIFSLTFFTEKNLSKNKEFSNLPLFAMAFFILLYILKILFTIEGSIEAIFKTLFFLPILLIAALTNISFSEKEIKRFVLTFLLICFFSDLIQVILYLTQNRLPALAHLEGKFVRFGGLWDDPNAFACFLMLPLALLFSQEKVHTLKKKLFITICIGMLFLTLSLTGLIMFFVLLSIDSLLKKRFWTLLTLGIIFGLIISFFNIEFIKDLVFDFYLSKENSISEHTNLTSALNNFSYFHVPFGIFTRFTVHESFYFSFIINFGLIPFTILIVIQTALLIRTFKYSQYFKKISFYEEAALFRGLFLFFICFFIGNCFLPFYSIFPINFLFWFLFLVSWNCIEFFNKNMRYIDHKLKIGENLS